jgi:hypothetical protein
MHDNDDDVNDGCGSDASTTSEILIDYSLLLSVQKQSVIVYLNQTTPIFLNLTEFIERNIFFEGIENNIYIYVSKYIYYKNIFYD